MTSQGGNYVYCSGCNGSFLLGFDNTSYGTSAGVFGAGFDVSSLDRFVAFVTFGDDFSANYSLSNGFFGITSAVAIKSIAIGGADGAATGEGYVMIDNLTIGRAADTGAVPEPATWGTMLLGFGGLGYAMRRRQRVGARVRFG